MRSLMAASLLLACFSVVVGLPTDSHELGVNPSHHAFENFARDAPKESKEERCGPEHAGHVCSNNQCCSREGYCVSILH